MVPKIIEECVFTLAGVDFYGNPYEQAGGWSEENAIGQLWNRFNAISEAYGGRIPHQVSETGYELWLGKGEDGNEHIFAGVPVDRTDELPPELMAKTLPRTRYAVFTLKGEGIRSDWPRAIGEKWLPAADLEQSHDYIIECYDPERFSGLDDPESELDVYVPIT